MNKYIESNSKKFLIMLLLICVVFLVVIIKAFEYIPVSDDDAVISRNNIENINKPAQNSEDTASDESTEENEEKKTLDINLTPDFVEKQKTEAPKEEKVAEPLENITDLPNDAVTANSSEETKPVELTPEEKAEAQRIQSLKYYYRQKAKLEMLKEKATPINPAETAVVEVKVSSISPNLGKIEEVVRYKVPINGE